MQETHYFEGQETQLQAGDRIIWYPAAGTMGFYRGSKRITLDHGDDKVAVPELQSEQDWEARIADIARTHNLGYTLSTTASAANHMAELKKL